MTLKEHLDGPRESCIIRLGVDSALAARDHLKSHNGPLPALSIDSPAGAEFRFNSRTKGAEAAKALALAGFGFSFHHEIT